MDAKKIRKGTGRLCGWLALVLSSLITKVLPPGGIYGFARGLSTVGYCFLSRQRRIALESLNIAFGRQKSPVELEQIARDCFRHMAKSAVELLFLLDRPRLIKERVELVGREQLDQALSQGRGVILVSAHFGNFPLLLARLALAGYSVCGIMRPMRDRRVESFFYNKRLKMGIKTIYSQPRDICVHTTIEALRHNQIVFMPLDQNFGSAGIFVDFFGIKAATATGPVVLAQRTKAALIPCFIIRQPDDRQKIVFEMPQELRKADSAQEALTINIQALTNIIERYIRKYPAEWGWIHRRWKSQMKANLTEGRSAA